MAQISWDAYDVPHIQAASATDLFYAFGRCQMRNHGDLLLRLYGQARGRAAEYWGAPYRGSDYFVRTMGIPARAAGWLRRQRPAFRRCLDAFAAGINDYAHERRDWIDRGCAAVLPVDAADILAHSQCLVNFAFVMNNADIVSAVRSRQQLGSNAWAVGPDRSASGYAMLLVNPHLPWQDMFRFFEAHLRAPGVDVYGVTCVGLPVLTMAFNARLGWAHTVNTHRGWTLYELGLAAGGYRFDGGVRAFDIEDATFAVRQDDGRLATESLTVRRSVHGPVVAASDGKGYAVRVAGLDRPRALEEWWRMGRAHSLAEFERVLRGGQIPTLTVLYADADGHVMHLFNGAVPIRDAADPTDWTTIVPGDTSRTLWNETHPYDDLPRVIDPPSGWLHNANDPPWTATVPAPLDREAYPAYMAPDGPMGMRAQQSAAMLLAGGRLRFEDLVSCRFSTRVALADRLLEPLAAAARRRGDLLLDRCAEVLDRWDRHVDAASRGAVLFAYWAHAMGPTGLFATPWSASAPLTTPCGLADADAAIDVLARVARRVETVHGALDVKWGDVFLSGTGNAENLGEVVAESLGVFAELWYTPTRDGRFAAIGGDAYSAVVEFADAPRAEVLLVYGNSTQPQLAGRSAQFDLYARKTMRPALRTRAAIDGACLEVERCGRDGVVCA